MISKWCIEILLIEKYHFNPNASAITISHATECDVGMSVREAVVALIDSYTGECMALRLVVGDSIAQREY